jgi:tetratricopeptide (TPR) repeat protein
MESSDRIELPRLKIVHWMLIAGVLAIVFFALTARPGDSVAGVIILVFLTLIAPILWSFRSSPLKAVLANLPDDPDEQVAALEEGLARFHLHDVNTTSVARYRLMELYKVRKRYEEAIAQGRLILKSSGLKPEFETEVGLEIAVCLDFLGRDQEAEAERMAAEDSLDEDPEDALGWYVRGKTLGSQHRYIEAAAAYEQALECDSPVNPAWRDDLLIRLMLATFNAGRPEETMTWAGRALELGGSESRQYQAHRMAGAACSNLGRREEAEHHRRRACEMAEEGGDPEKISDCLASLADLHRLRGDLDRAESLCLEAESRRPDSARAAASTYAMVLRDRGRLDEALARMEHASRVGVLSLASSERRVQAVLKAWMATCRAELGRLAEAWDDLREAVTNLAHDPKLGLVCEAARIRLLAHQGQREETIRLAEALLTDLGDRTLDPSTQLECLDLVGRALVALGEYERGRACWERFLAIVHPPIAGPTGHYFLGECRWHLGDEPGALDAFRRATAPGIDSHPARLAAQRSREIALKTDGPASDDTVPR